MRALGRAAAVTTTLALAAACSEDRASPSPTAAVVHGVGVADPASPAFHGALLRREHWAGMLDANADDACGRCHDGSPAPVASVRVFAPGATACTTCHAAAGGPLACTTCHAPAGAHDAHVSPSAASASGLGCATCHPAVGTPLLGGRHGNGIVDVVLQPGAGANGSAFDGATGACAVACHAMGGARPRPRWSETTSMACGDCHTSPPAAHFAGPCTACHAEANATGTTLARVSGANALHMNGRIDVGNGDGTCAACHGASGDPWPTSAAHRLHERSALTTAIACADCHVVPTTIGSSGHLDGVATVVFGSRASQGQLGAVPAWDGTRCSNVVCHGAALAAAPAPSPAWRDAGEPGTGAGSCGGCHGMPPLQHTPSTSCERSTCHGTEVARDAAGALSITAAGRALHMNGVIDHATP